MNKIIYAIGIVVATSFSSHVKAPEKSISDEKKTPVEHVQKIIEPVKADSLQVIKE